MAKRTQEDEKDFEAWLLSFEKQAGIPVIVSLLIEKDQIKFISCVNKIHFNIDGEADDSSPELVFQDIKENKQQPITSMSVLNYIG